MAPVPLKRKRDTSAEPKTDPVKRTYMRVPDEAKLWFQDFHAYQARVHGKSARLQHSPGEASGAGALLALVRPTRSEDGMKAGHVTSAADPWTCHRSPFRVSRTFTHAVAARLSLQRPHLAARLPPCAARARHRIRRQTMDAAVLTHPVALIEARGDVHPPQAERG